MALVTTEVEISSSLSASRLFNVFMDFDNIAPKVDPQMYKSVNTIEGDGDVGTIKCITYGDGVPFTSSKHKMDTINKSNLSFGWTVFEGDLFLAIIDSATHHVKFVPSAEGGSIFKHSVVFKCKGDAKLTEDTVNQVKLTFTKTFKALESYAVAHPDAY